jgi:hypothetical protein
MQATQTRTNAAAKTKPEAPAGEKTAQTANPIWELLTLGGAAIQPKLALNQPNDPHEQEADRIADRVIRMSASQTHEFKPSLPLHFPLLVQRKCAACEEEEEQVVRRKEAGANPQMSASPNVSPALNSPGQPLDPDTRTFMEQRLDHDFGNVRVHTDHPASESARAVNALAFTLGRDVVFAPGQYRPESDPGRRLLAHELTHVVQQSSSHVSEIQRVIEVRPPGRGEATAFGRRQELIDRMNQVSTGTRFRLDGQVLALDEVLGGTLTNFEQQIRRLMGLTDIVPMRLITSAGRAGGGPVTVDDFPSAYVDLDDLLASDDLSFQMNLIHLLVERSRVRNYARRIGTASLGRDPATGLPPAEFTRAHNVGIEAEAELLRSVIGDPTIRFNFEENKPNGTVVFAFRSNEGYRIFHVFRGAGRALQHGEIFVQTRDDRRLTIVQLIAERAAAAAAAAPPVAAPPVAAPPVAAPPVAAPPVQPKLALSQPNDLYELEADRVADRVMRVTEPGLQRKCACSSGTTCSECQPAEEVTHRKAGNAASTPGRFAAENPLGGLGEGRPLEPAVRSFFEPRFGQDFSQVRLHTNRRAENSAAALGAKAFTYGNSIAFANGHYDPASDEGRRLLAHELTHIVQQPGQLARDPDPAAPRRCLTGRQVGAAHGDRNDHLRGPSGTYYIRGPAYSEGDAAHYSDLCIQAWIPWRFGTVSSAVTSRIRTEASQWVWWWSGADPVPGCQYTTAMSMVDMARLVRLAERDPAARQAEGRETGAGMPALPPPEPIADFEIVVTVRGGSSGGQSDAGDSRPPESPTRPLDTRAEAERALDPTSVYEAGRPGSNAPPFPARMDGPEMEVPRGIGTYTMALNYAAVTSDPLMQIAYHMNAVSYHWELFNITEMVRAGMGRGVEQEAQRMGQTTPESRQAAAAAGGATSQRARHAGEQLSEETIRSWEELRDPRRAAEGGSAIDVLTRTWANALNLYLLPASAIIAAGGQALGGLADLLGAYSQEREIAFPNRQGFYMVRCIAQPAPRGPNRSERRAASVNSKIVEVRTPELLARNALEMPEARIAQLQAERAMTSDAAAIQRLDEQIAAIREQSSGDIVTYLTRLVNEKQREHDAAPTWQRDRLARELSSLRLRLSQAQANRAGTTTQHRPRAAFTSIVTGETYPLLLELSELSSQGQPRVRLMDLTVPDREPIERNGATLEQAVRNAFNELAFHGELGRGRLVVQMPPSWTHGPANLSLQTGDASTAIVRRRLQDLATALLVLSLVVPGVGEVSAVIAAGLAVERLLRRAINGTLRLDAESVSDTLAILGAVAQGAQLVGRLRIARAGNSFVAAARTTDQAAIEAAATALDAARRAGRILDVTSTVTNVGGLIWGDAVAIRQLALIQQEELDGTITHAAASRRRAEMLASAVTNHGIMLAGMMRPQGADRTAGVEPAPATPREAPPAAPEAPATPEAPPAQRPAAGRESETIPEPELERRAGEAQPRTAAAEPAQPRNDSVRVRFRSRDGLHEIFILNDGRIFRCSLTCAQLRTWYNPYLSSQPEGTRRQTATELDGALQALEGRAARGENSPELNQAIANLDSQIREFIAPDVARELQLSFQSRNLVEPGETLLTPAQTHNLLRVFSLDSLQQLAAGTQSAHNLRLLANLWGEVLSTATAPDVVRLRALNERIRPTDEQAEALGPYFEARRDAMARAIGDLEAAQSGPELQRIAQRDPIIPPGTNAGVATAVDSMLTRFTGRRVTLDAGLRALLREHLQNNPGGMPPEAFAAIADARGLAAALRAAAGARVTPTATAAPTRNDPRYGYAVRGHGMERDAQGMMSEAAARRRVGVPQGQFYNDATIIDADTLAAPGDGERFVTFPNPIGRVFRPDGTVLSDVNRVLVVRGNGGAFFDAYPIPPER